MSGIPKGFYETIDKFINANKDNSQTPKGKTYYPIDKEIKQDSMKPLTQDEERKLAEAVFENVKVYSGDVLLDGPRYLGRINYNNNDQWRRLDCFVASKIKTLQDKYHEEMSSAETIIEYSINPLQLLMLYKRYVAAVAEGDYESLKRLALELL